MAVNESKITTPQAVLADLCPSVHTIFLQVKKSSLATGGSVDKRTPSPPNDHKARRPRTLTKPRTEQAQSPKTIQRPVKSQESSLRPIDPPEAPPYTNPFMHVNPYNTFLPSESPYIPNDSLNPNGLSHNAALDLEYTMNEPFLDLGPHSHYFQAPATVHSPEVTINDHIYSTTVRFCCPFKRT
ncbi:unnamed protein product [Rhizoctonia solani]|uniref:Uncharacterized protein n=1 Tax=Rhizoctonia solani TaxID=456999 RepID=A0A8H3BLK9_9AGAM|nr:unnamed protein product [Rhizoctonia solani]